MKNHISNHWSDGKDHHFSTDPDMAALADAVNVTVPNTNNDSTPKVSLISDSDKDYLRNVLIDAILRTKDPIR